MAQRTKAGEAHQPLQQVESSQNRAQSRRQMPSHLFHPSGPSTQTGTTDYQSHRQESSTTNLLATSSHDGTESGLQGHYGRPVGVGPAQKAGKASGVIQISRDNIKPPSSNTIQAQSSTNQSNGVRRGSSIVKRGSVLTQRANQTHAKQRMAVRKVSKDDLHDPLE